MIHYELSRRALIGAAAAAAAAFAAPYPSTAQEKPTIKLGFIGPVSGGNAQQGLGARNGFLLAVEEINARADYPYKVEPVALDDASDPQTGVGAAMRLVNDSKVVGAIGHWNSPVALATIPVFNRAQIPFIVWGAISPKITEQNLPVVTRVTPTLLAENQPLAEWAAKKLGIKKVAIVSDTSDYGTGNAKAFSDFFGSNGGTTVSTNLLPVGTTDFRAVLTKIKGSDAQAIYFGGVIAEAGILRKQQMELGLDMPMLGISGFYDPGFISIAGAAAEGTMVSYPASQSNPKLDKLYADYKARNFAEPTSPYTKYAYDAANIMLTAIKAVGIEDKVALARYIRSIEYDGVLGVTKFDANGQTMIPVKVEIKVVKDGKWVNKED